MKIIRTVRLSWRALATHRLRTALAVCGTAIGVAAFITTVAAGAGAEREILARVDALGRNVLMVYAGDVQQTPVRPGTAGVGARTLRLHESDEIANAIPSVEHVAPSQQRDLLIKAGGFSTMATVRGTTPVYERIRQYVTPQGRFFTAAENTGAERVAVIGDRVREVLFADDHAVGKWIRINRIPFRVIGVLERRGMSVDGGGTEDDVVLIPLQTALRRVFNVDYLEMMFVQVRAPERMGDAEAAITALLQERHGREDFQVENPRALLAAELSATRSFRNLIVTLGSIALGVGGVGILSLMTLSVRERRSEVGLRMAVGARRRDIRAQFLFEALGISALGSVLGTGLAVVTVRVMPQYTEWPAVLSASSVMLAVGAALLVASVFGVYPAHRASTWQPVTALQTR